MKRSDYPNSQTARKQILHIDCIIGMSVTIGELRVRPCVGVVKNLAFDVLLSTFFIDDCIRGILPGGCKVVP